MKWNSHFIAIHENCCALGGSQDTAISRAERRSSDDKGKAVAIDEHSRIRPIDDHHGHQHCIGMFFSASLPEEVLAFEDAASRDAQISKLKVRKSLHAAARSALAAHKACFLAFRFCLPSPIRLNRRYRPPPPRCSRRSRKSRFAPLVSSAQVAHACVSGEASGVSGSVVQVLLLLMILLLMMMLLMLLLLLLLLKQIAGFMDVTLRPANTL